jgi:hypothetical protein
MRRWLSMLVPAGLVIASTALALGPGSTSTSPRESIHSAGMGIGFNLSHTHFALNRAPSCASQGQSADVSGQDAVVTHYNDPAVRAATVSILNKLHQEGASVVRIVFWFRASEDLALDGAHQAPDPLGLIVSKNGHIPDGYLANLIQLTEDIRKSGYKEVIAVLANQGRSNPTCRADGIWGGCYQSKFDDLTWSVKEEIIRALKSTQLSPLDVVFDIAGEDCFTHDDSLLERNLGHVSRYMIEHYLSTFADNKYTESCGGEDVQRTLRQLEYTGSFFMSLSHKPSFIDVHAYFPPGNRSAQVLLASEQLAKRLEIPWIIGETYADDQDLFETVKTMQEKNQLSDLHDIIVWPRTEHSACASDVDPGSILRWVAPVLLP